MIYYTIGRDSPGDVATEALREFQRAPFTALEVYPRLDGRPHRISGDGWDFIGGPRVASFFGTASLWFPDADHVRFVNPNVGPAGQELITGQWRQEGAQLELVNCGNVDLDVRVEWGDVVVRNSWEATGLSPALEHPVPQSEMVTLRATTVLGGVYLIGDEGAGSFRGMSLTARTFGPVALAMHNASAYHSVHGIKVLAWATKDSDGKLPWDPLCFEDVSFHGSDVTLALEGRTSRPGRWKPKVHWQTGQNQSRQCRSFNLSYTHRHVTPFRFHGHADELPPWTFTDSMANNTDVFQCSDGFVRVP